MSNTGKVNIRGKEYLTVAYRIYAYWLRSKIKHADLPPEVQAFAEEAQREFFENLGEML
jgi:hypothetical protein